MLLFISKIHLLFSSCRKNQSDHSSYLIFTEPKMACLVPPPPIRNSNHHIHNNNRNRFSVFVFCICLNHTISHHTSFQTHIQRLCHVIRYHFAFLYLWMRPSHCEEELRNCECNQYNCKTCAWWQKHLQNANRKLENWKENRELLSAISYHSPKMKGRRRKAKKKRQTKRERIEALKCCSTESELYNYYFAAMNLSNVYHLIKVARSLSPSRRRSFFSHSHSIRCTNKMGKIYEIRYHLHRFAFLTPLIPSFVFLFHFIICLPFSIFFVFRSDVKFFTIRDPEMSNVQQFNDLLVRCFFSSVECVHGKQADMI